MNDSLNTGVKSEAKRHQSKVVTNRGGVVESKKDPS